MKRYRPLSHCPSPKGWDSGTLHRTSTRGHRLGQKCSSALDKEQAMFSLRSNGLLCEAQNSRSHGGHSTKRGGRPKGDPCAVRCMTIGVRVNAAEWANLQHRAQHMGMTPAQWLRTAALSRRLPSPPVPETSRAAYGELARLGINLNQIARAANAGRISVDSGLLRDILLAIAVLQRGLLGVAAKGEP